MENTNNNYLNSQYLFFSLDNEKYAVEAIDIQEIVDYKPIKHIPKSNKAIKGVTNIRGDLIPIVDSKVRLNLGEIKFSKRTSFIIFKIIHNEKNLHIGLVVDLVIEVEEIEEHNLLKSPEFGTKIDQKYIQNIIKNNDEYITVLNIDNFFNIEELAKIERGE